MTNNQYEYFKSENARNNRGKEQALTYMLLHKLKHNQHNYRKNYDKDLDVRGCDIIADNNRYIDIKAKSSKAALNKKAFTIPIELYSKMKGENYKTVRFGWFLNPKNITTEYCFLYDLIADSNNKIYDFEYAFITKQKLIDYLSRNGLYRTTLQKIALNLMKQHVPCEEIIGRYGKYYKYYFNDNIAFIFNIDMPEQSIIMQLNIQALQNEGLFTYE